LLVVLPRLFLVPVELIPLEELGLALLVLITCILVLVLLVVRHVLVVLALVEKEPSVLTQVCVSLVLLDITDP
jgi:hypothetical protein